MRRLSKRWETIKSIANGSLHRTFLPETPRGGMDLCWACIEFKDPKGPFLLEIWDGTESEWEEAGTFPTLKQAKEVGRLLAGVALAKIF